MIRKLVTTLTLAGAAMAISVGPAAAGHCADNGGPGHSDFATHVRSTNGPGEHNEGDHQGWSSCEENAHGRNAGGRNG